MFWSIFSANADVVDSLEVDTYLETPSGNICFKGGTLVVKNNEGKVIKGTPAVDIDLWTTGPLIFFSRKHPITFNNSGLVVRGVPAMDFIGQTCDGSFHSFSAGYMAEWNKNGKIISATIDAPFPITIDNQEITLKSKSLIKYYDNGQIMLATPDNNIKLKISPTEIVNFMEGKIIRFNKKGMATQGVLAKKTTFVLQNGNEMVLSQGSKVKFDDNGFLIIKQ